MNNSTSSFGPYPVPSWVVDNNTLRQYLVYGYQVNQGVAFAAMALYFLVFLYNTAWTSTYTKNASFMYIVSLTALAEALGYLFRVISANSYTLGNFLATLLLILLPPIFLLIVNYTTLARLMRSVNASFGCLTPNNITRTFLTLDILCFVLQVLASPLLLSNDPAQIKSGQNVILAGLVLQLALFLWFFALTWKVAALPAFDSPHTPIGDKLALNVCLTTVALLLLRNAYKVYEYAEGTAQRDARATTVITKSEVTFYILEFLPVFIAHLIFMFRNPGWLLGGETVPMGEGIEGGGGDGGLKVTQREPQAPALMVATVAAPTPVVVASMAAPPLVVATTAAAPPSPPGLPRSSAAAAFAEQLKAGRSQGLGGLYQ